MTSQTSLTDKIPSGVWTLYFHSPGEKKWSLDTFHVLGAVSTWGEYWSLINALDDSKWTRGMFFWMRNPIPPLWENFQNIRGGCYSICMSESFSVDVFHRYTIGCMCSLATTKDDILHGITISPKKGFHVIKLWNKDAAKFNRPEGMMLLDSHVRVSDIRYMPHVEKRM